MVSEENTIYIVQYDYILKNNITIPTNCVLKFEGGSINGAYTITGQNTGIQAGLVKIFNTNVTLAGSWNLSEAYPEWFGAKGDGVADDTYALQKVIDLAYKVSISKGTYKISYSTNRYYSHNNTNIYYGLLIKNNHIIFNDATIVMDGFNSPNYFMLFLLDAQNTILSGNGVIIGDKDTHLTPDDPEGYGHCISIMLGNNINIDGLTLKDGWGDGIWIMNNGYADCLAGKFPENITINHVLCDGNRKNGMGVLCGKHINVLNSQFNNSTEQNPKAGLDIEANGDGYCLQDIHVSNIQSYGCTEGGVGAILKTDYDSVYFSNIQSDTGIGVRIESGCDKGYFSARGVTCIEADGLTNETLEILNCGTNCNIDFSDVYIKPNVDRAGVLIGNSEETSRINISDIKFDLGNYSYTLRHCPFFLSAENRPGEFPTPGHLYNLAIRNCTIYDGTIYGYFICAASGCVMKSIDAEIKTKNINIVNEDNYADILNQTTWDNVKSSTVKIDNNSLSEIPVPAEAVSSRKEIRGFYSYYKYSGGYTGVNFRYIPSGNTYYIENVSNADMPVGFGGLLVRYNGADGYAVTVPTGKILKCKYDVGFDKIIAEIM